MRHLGNISQRSIFLMALGLALVLGAAACAGNIPVTHIAIPTSLPSHPPANPAAPTPTSALQILPTDTGQADPAATATTASGQVSFTQNVLPIFQANCTGCHGANRQSAGLDFSNYAGIVAAEGRGVIVPGDAANSRLVQVIEAGIMPRGGTPLSASDIQTIVNWINAGAPNN